MSSHNINILLDGDSGTGRGSLIARYVDDTWTDSYINYNDIGPKSKELMIDDTRVRINLYRNINNYSRTPLDYSRAIVNAIVVVFDLTYNPSFESAKGRIQTIRENKTYNPDIPIILVGNMSDRAISSAGKSTPVSSEDITVFSENNDVQYFAVSAKDGTNVNNLFNNIAHNNLIKYSGSHQNSSSTATFVSPSEYNASKVSEITNVFMGIRASYGEIVRSRSEFFYGQAKRSPQREEALRQIDSAIVKFTENNPQKKKIFFKEILKIRNNTEQSHHQSFWARLGFIKSDLLTKIDEQLTQCVRLRLITRDDLEQYQNELNNERLGINLSQ